MTVHSPTGQLSDGSGPYRPFSWCAWILRPQGASRLSLTFSVFELESGNDFVRVYAGTSESGRLVTELTGTDLPHTIDVDSCCAYVTFVSDGSAQAEGFVVAFSSGFATTAGSQNSSVADSSEHSNASNSTLAYPTSKECGGEVAVSGSNTQFGTAGNGEQYAPNAWCAWKIELPTTLRLTLAFSVFATESGYDFVRVYAGSNASPANLVTELTGTELPPPIDVDGCCAYVTFISDTTVSADGFLAVVTATSDFDGARERPRSVTDLGASMVLEQSEAEQTPDRTWSSGYTAIVGTVLGIMCLVLVAAAMAVRRHSKRKCAADSTAVMVQSWDRGVGCSVVSPLPSARRVAWSHDVATASVRNCVAISSQQRQTVARTNGTVNDEPVCLALELEDVD